MITGNAEQIATNLQKSFRPTNEDVVCVVIQHHNAYVGTLTGQISEINKQIEEQTRLPQTGLELKVVRKSSERRNMQNGQSLENAQMKALLNELTNKIAEHKRETDAKTGELLANIEVIERQNRELEQLVAELTSLKNEMEARMTQGETRAPSIINFGDYND